MTTTTTCHEGHDNDINGNNNDNDINGTDNDVNENDNDIMVYNQYIITYHHDIMASVGVIECGLVAENALKDVGVINGDHYVLVVG